MRAAKKIATKTSAKPVPFVPRVIPILEGDVFGVGSYGERALVVVMADVDRCDVRRAGDGKASRIQTARLHNEYHRLGVIAQKRAHKKLAAIMAREAKGGK